MNDNDIRRWVTNMANEWADIYGIAVTAPVLTLDDYGWFMKGVRLMELRHRLEQHVARWSA